MPQWIHDRARHIQAKNPGMAESTAFAIATQQSHSVGKTPKGYGTNEGRQAAKAKYDTPKDDKKTADPGGIGGKLEKDANIFRAIAPMATQEQDDRMRQIIREELRAHAAPQQPQQPSLKVKKAFSLALIGGFSDELQKIKTAQMTMSSVAPKPTVSSQVTARVPRNTMSASTPRYSQVNPAPMPGPTQSHQPVLSPPPVRG